MPNLYLERVTNSASVPVRKTEHAACYDIQANLINRNVKFYRHGNNAQTELYNGKYKIYPGERVLIPTGWKMCCDSDYKIEIAPRSGNAIKQGLTLINAIGIIDADYRDEVMLLMINHGHQVIEITDGMRLGQLSLERVEEVNMVICIDELPKTDSNRMGGLGHTGDK